MSFPALKSFGEKMLQTEARARDAQQKRQKWLGIATELQQSAKSGLLAGVRWAVALFLAGCGIGAAFRLFF